MYLSSRIGTSAVTVLRTSNDIYYIKTTTDETYNGSDYWSQTLTSLFLLDNLSCPLAELFPCLDKTLDQTLQ